VTFTAAVTPATATGTVQLYDGDASIGSGTATLSISTLAVTCSPFLIQIII
jgi:hypothetical protein